MVKREPPPQLAKARAIFAERFRSPEEKSAYYRRLGQQAAARRIVLSGDVAEALSGRAEALAGKAEAALDGQAEVLADVYDFLREIAQRTRATAPSPEPTDLDAA